MNKGRLAVIVQARMASSRLPGKVLKTLAGETVLAHVLHRCSAINGCDVVCCAIPESGECDVLAREAEHHGAAVFRGSETDVLDRYSQAASACDAEVVMRVTSDCPVIDPEICSQVVALLRQNDLDYACNNMPPSFPHGLDCEVFTRAWLERAAHEATRPYDREHVTPFMRNHRQIRKLNLTCSEPNVVSHRWTLDTPDDYKFFQNLFGRMPDGMSSWSWKVPLSVVNATPELAKINAIAGRRMSSV